MGIKVVKNSVRDAGAGAPAGKSPGKSTRPTVGSGKTGTPRIAPRIAPRAAARTGTPDGSAKKTTGPAKRKPASGRARAAASDMAWVKWAVLAGVGVIGLVFVCIAVSLDQEQKVSRPDVREWNRPSEGGRASNFSDFDMKQWCEEHEADNKALRERRQRRVQPSP